MSLNETHKNVPKASLLGISSILPKGSEEYCLIDNENTVAEITYDNFDIEIEQLTFSLDEEYLKTVIDIENTSETSETDSSIFDDDDSISEIGSEDNDIIIEQKASKNLTRCVIVDKINGYIKRCENSKSFRLWQLCGVYQIDGESIIEADGVLEQLGVCSYHFNSDQKNLHEAGFKQLKDTSQSVLHRKRCLFCGKLYYFFTRGTGCEKHSWEIIERNVQVVCNGQFNCSALESYNSLCERAFDKIKNPRYVCCNCYEYEGGHFHIRPGRGREILSCKKRGDHEEDIKKNLKILANWLLHVANNENFEYQKNILTAILPQISPFFNSKNKSTMVSESDISNTPDKPLYSNQSAPSYFILRTVMKLNQIPIEFQEEELNEQKYKEIGREIGQKLWQSYKYLKKNINNLQTPESLNNYISAFPRSLMNFFESMLTAILEKKTAESNRKRLLKDKSLKELDSQKINHLLSLLISALINFTFPYLNLWLPNVLASLCRRPKLLSSLHDLLTKCTIIGHTNRHERRLEKTRMKSADPSKRLLTEKNVFNLAVIDNIDFKERSFQFGNIYDVTRCTSHATLRMVFQFLLPEVISEKPEPTRELNIDTQIFGTSKEVRDIIFKINEIFISLLEFRYNERQELEYNKIDLTVINSEILRQTEFGCNLPPPNVVILEPSGSPNDDNEILRATEMYRKDFSLDESDFLDICADEAIFRRLIKCRNKSENIRPILDQWHTSKDMMSALITLFSSYGIYDLATALGVKFLDKFAAVIDYRSTRRVLELIWVAVGVAINIYLQKSNIKIEEILSCPANERICLKIWYLYYEWFTIWKTHLTGIRCGNYELQKFRLAAFAPLFPAVEKSNYATSVTHFLANLEKYPLLEKKLHLCASINLAKEGHYPAFDEALETHGVAYIKQNITGNSCDQKNLELQIKATQEERNRLDTLLNEFLGTYTYQRKDRNTNNRIEPLWKLVHDLLEAFEMDSPINHDLFKKNSPPQLNQEGLIRINQAYMDGLKRIKEIYRQEVIKTEAINTKGRRMLSVMKTKITDLSKNKKPKKSTVPKNNGNQSSDMLPIQSNEQNLQSVKGNLKRASIELDNQENVETEPQSKRRRIITTEEEK